MREVKDSKERCGCGRAVGEVVRALVILEGLPVEGWEESREWRRRHAGRWLLASVPVECGVERASLTPVLKSMDRGDWKDATAELMDLMKDCAGMTS